MFYFTYNFGFYFCFSNLKRDSNQGQWILPACKKIKKNKQE